MIVLKKPLITEKTIRGYKEDNKVAFIVSESATKDTAAKALESVYGVTVVDAKVVNRLGKKRSDFRHGTIVRKTPNRKIIVFKLKKGDKIDLFEK